jgi:hypothetical protein
MACGVCMIGVSALVARRERVASTVTDSDTDPGASVSLETGRPARGDLDPVTLQRREAGPFDADGVTTRGQRELETGLRCRCA